MIDRLTVAALPVPRFRYSQIVRAQGFYHVSGMIALDRDTGALETGGAGAEAAKILGNLKAALDEIGRSLSDLVEARIYVTDFAKFGDVNAAWEAVFDATVPPPARTSVGVSALPLGATVEMEFRLVAG